MENFELNEEDKYILLGNLLKKDYPEKTLNKIFDFIQEEKTNDEKLDFLLALEQNKQEKKAHKESLQKKDSAAKNMAKIRLTRPSIICAAPASSQRFLHSLESHFTLVWAQPHNCLHLIQQYAPKMVILFEAFLEIPPVLDFIESEYTSTYCVIFSPNPSQAGKRALKIDYVKEPVFDYQAVIQRILRNL